MRRRSSLPLATATLTLLAPFALAASTSCSSESPGATPADAGTGDATAGDALADAPIDHVRIPYDGSGPAPGARTKVTAEVVSPRADVQSLMFAAGEMQISGEPFAQHFAGRNLGNYDRTALPTDQYIVQTGGDAPTSLTDLFGFSTAVESYEYSKYHMNMISQETGAGLSLANGPVMLARETGATRLDKLRAHAARLFITAGTDVAGYAVLPAPASNNQNYLGFSGLWPVFAPFKSFDSTLQPHHEAVQSCTFAGGYGGIPTLGATLPEYECAYNSLHLGTTSGADPALDLAYRRTAVESVLVPAVLGFATWKQALWSIDFTSRLHDAKSNPVNDVAVADRPKVGSAGNLIVATDPAGAARGTYIGSTALEGMWGMMMLSEMENSAELAISQLTTTDGTTLGGFATRADAVAYDYTSPLRWFPAAVTVTEDLAVPYPAVTSYAIADAGSRSVDLAALLLGNAMFFGMTDARNAALGGQLGLTLTFDGAPFPADDGAAGFEDTAHDRALAVLRVAFVDLDRMHADPALGVVMDSATVTAGVVTRGTTVTTTALSHVIIGLRQTLLSLNAAITQYGASDPDPAIDAKGILNAFAIHPAQGGTPQFSSRVRQVFATNAAFVRDVLTKPDGSVANGATLAGGQFTADPAATTLEAQAAAVRALIEGFLVTGDPTFRDRARVVSTKLLTAFYSTPGLLFRGVLGGPDQVHMTPERFGWLQSALRETHKVVHLTGDPLLDRSALEPRIARVNKLFLNGWDDLNGDGVVDVNGECLGARMQLAEQSLTGELGRDDVGRSTSDRDKDCVPEIDDAQRASVLAAEVLFHL